MTSPTTLLDTRNIFDASLCGYDSPADPYNSSEGLVVHFFRGPGPACVQLIGGDGCVELVGLPEIREVAKSLAQVVEILSRKESANG